MSMKKKKKEEEEEEEEEEKEEGHGTECPKVGHFRSERNHIHFFGIENGSVIPISQRKEMTKRVYFS
jgi:hypothetical protein